MEPKGCYYLKEVSKMAGYKKGSKAMEDMLVRRFGNDLRKIYEKAPQAEKEIVTLAKHIGEVLDTYLDTQQNEEIGLAIFLIDKDNKVTEIEP
jgi:hypothetical protein